MAKGKRRGIKRSFPARFSASAIKTGMGRPNIEVLREYHERAASLEVELTRRQKKEISEALGLNLENDKRWQGQIWDAKEAKYKTAAEHYSQKATIFLENSVNRFFVIHGTDVRLFVTPDHTWFFVQAGWKSTNYASKDDAMEAFDHDRVSYLYQFSEPSDP